MGAGRSPHDRADDVVEDGNRRHGEVQGGCGVRFYATDLAELQSARWFELKFFHADAATFFLQYDVESIFSFC